MLGRRDIIGSLFYECRFYTILLFHFTLSYFVFFLPLFLFRAPWVVAANEGAGRRGAHPQRERVDPLLDPGADSASLTSPGALSESDRGLRATPPSGPSLSREPESRLPEPGIGWGSRREQKQGLGRGCGVCFALRLCAGAVRPPFHFLGWRASPFLAHPGPSLGSGVASLLRPSLCRTRRCLALPCLARVSLLPQHYLSAIFIHYLQEDAFGGILGRRLQRRSLRTALPEAVPC